MLVHSDDWNGSYVQVYGTAEVLDMPSAEAEEGLVEYFRCISGEHPDWDDYRDAMRRQGKSLIRVTVNDWGPVAHGGFPAGPGAGLRGPTYPGPATTKGPAAAAGPVSGRRFSPSAEDCAASRLPPVEPGNHADVPTGGGGHGRGWPAQQLG